ncbi:AEC family transporter [Gordonia sp. HY002]|uniref:AEC family transporter n=1 Tax=Gordonia zhenghanii TaxID=2911516 RepID=UPI001EF012C3|nr:AEC family transporter [Gordonia zhenghanii]MCF8570269.1 AEC family transporter [Gordonia zhenghanii]MCF8607918.1 AEC family transporter [Gordonia zhenghanii]
MSGVVSGFTVIFIIVGLGYLLGRTGALGDHASTTLSRLVFFVCTPALLVHSLATSDLSAVFSSTLAIASISALSVGLVYLVVARLWLRREIPELVVGALSSSYVNTVNLGLPIAIFVLDDESFIAPLLLFQIVFYSPVALATLDLTALDGSTRTSVWRTVAVPLRNPILIGGAVGLIVSVSGWTPPQSILESADMLGRASAPLALLAFGLTLTGVTVFKKGESPRRDIVLASILKMFAMPLIAYATARWMFGLTGHKLFGQVVIAALPTAQNVLVYATRYRHGEILARDSALVTTLLSIPVIAVTAWLLT